MTVDETVAAIEGFLSQGVVGHHGLYSTDQQNWREAWSDVLAEVSAKCNEDFERWNPVRLMMIAAIERHGGDQVQIRRRVFAVNTTLHGREDEVR